MAHHAGHAFPIGILASESGVKIETVRYYEKIGIMPRPARSAGGYRLYTPDHLKRLTFIRRGRELGFGLDELRTLLRLVDGHTYTCAEVRALTLDHVADIRRKISDLRRLERVMTEIASHCSGKRVPECPIVDALFDSASFSVGSRKKIAAQGRACDRITVEPPRASTRRVA